MAVYYYVKCPHCKKIVESGRGRTEQYGSPIRKCQHCGKTYVDNNYVEAAFFNEEQLKKRASSWKNYIWVAIGIWLLVVGIFEAIGEIITIAIVISGIGVFSIIYNYSYEPNNDKSLQEELEKSKERLSNPQYIITLYKAGSFVPIEQVEWAKEVLGYKKYSDKSQEKSSFDEEYDKTRYKCKSLKYISDAGEGKCMVCCQKSKV